VGRLLLVVGFALGVSFLCSLLEAALLSVRTSELTHRKARGSRGAGLLLELKQTRLGDAITAILTLNTVAHTLGATLAGAQAAVVFGSAWVGVFSGVLTFLILVFSEIIPKTLGAVYAEPLSGFVGRTLHRLTFIMNPLLILSRAVTRLLTRDRQAGVSRGELAAIINLATRDGAISSDESSMLASLLRFREVQVEDVMTPRTVTVMAPVEATVGELLADAEAEVFSRIPLFSGNRDNVVGYVLQRDLLRSVAQGGDRDQPLERFKRPAHFIPELASVESALRQILQRREPIAMVTDEHGGVAGLVTLEDLTETILGTEIIDESDRVIDMRQAAVRLRDERLERLRQERRLRLGGTGPGSSDQTEPEPRD
jgi:CBS domain containing-hemolysin-like protein